MRVPTAELVFCGPPDLDAAQALVAERLAIVPGRGGAHDRTLVDTFDGRLRAAGLAGEPPSARTLREVVAPRALLPVARVRTRAREIAVVDDRAKTVVRITLARHEIVRRGEEPHVLRVRARVDGVLGYREHHELAVARLQEAGAFTTASEPFFDAVSRAVGRDPAGISSKPKVALVPGSAAGSAASALLGRLAEIARLNVPGARQDLDAEFLHDLRVSVRRARSVLRELKAVFDPEALGHLRDELKWVQAATGPVRDLDVQLEDWDELVAPLDGERRRQLEPLRAMVREQRTAAVRALRRVLDGPRFAQALLAMGAVPATGPRAHEPVEALAAERITGVYRRMVRDGRRIDDDSPDEDLHDLRKRGKELRYLLELFGTPLFEADVVKPLVAALKELQDVLGRFQDRHVQAHLLEDAGRRLAARGADPTALMALGVAIEALSADQRAARAAFQERFAAFAAKDRRALVKETFGS